MSNILKVLNRPSQKKEQEKQNEIKDRKRGPWIIRNIKWVMFAFFNAVALVFDALAVSTVYTLTNGSVLFSALALLPTGVPMFMWEGGWLYPLADPKQKKKAISGVVLSVVSALVVGTLAIFANLGTGDTRFWVSATLLTWCVIVVVVHGVLAAFYFYKDPEIQRDHELQVVIADNAYQEETLRESENLLRAAENLLSKEQELKKKFGDKEVNRALELLLNIDLNGDGRIGDRQPQYPPAHTDEHIQNNSSGIQMDEFLRVVGMTRGQARAHWIGKEYQDFASDVSPRFEHISGNDMKKIYGELVQSNGHKANP